MYREVEINTPLELARHLVNVGDLYVGETKIRLSADDTGSTTPFLCHDGSSSTEIWGYWATRSFCYYQKLEWQECIPKGKRVPCYVSDSDPTSVGTERNICGYDPESSQPYLAERGSWKYATPIPAEELWMPEL